MKPPLQKLIDQTEIIHKENDSENYRYLKQYPSLTKVILSTYIQQAADFILTSAHPQDRNTLPVQHQLQNGEAPQPGKTVNRPSNKIKEQGTRSIIPTPGSGGSPINQSQDSLGTLPANGRPAQAVNQSPA
ncbi:hypothetical protein Pmani_013371 [Petrolisthes manimaculis]|uniref:Uncharacterized protein n=1 Tax=Petrolisthes manimaculis TaxID=1843537 RepID=A0AAE1UDS2_9EUCA|nr:hypothetical protein Pmani_013371 [Petrolisthes manimaculis]